MQVLPSLVQVVVQSPSHALRYQLWLPLPQAGGEPLGGGGDGLGGLGDGGGGDGGDGGDGGGGTQSELQSPCGSSPCGTVSLLSRGHASLFPQ